MTDFTKIILRRFILGGLTSAVSAMVVITPVGVTNFHDIQPWLLSLAVAGIIGLITGGLQAIDKAYRYDASSNI